MIGPFWLIKGGGDQEKKILLGLIDCVVRFCGGRSGAKGYSYYTIYLYIKLDWCLYVCLFGLYVL